MPLEHGFRRRLRSALTQYCGYGEINPGKLGTARHARMRTWPRSCSSSPCQLSSLPFPVSFALVSRNIAKPLKPPLHRSLLDLLARSLCDRLQATVVIYELVLSDPTVVGQALCANAAPDVIVCQVPVMALLPALDGDYRSLQVIAAILVDTFNVGRDAPNGPCPHVCLSALAILPHGSQRKPGLLDPEESGIEVTRLRVRYPDVFRCCVEFLAAPRTHQQRRQICSRTREEGCLCDRKGNTLLDELHKWDPISLHNPYTDESQGESFLGSVATFMLLFYSSLPNFNTALPDVRALFKILRASEAAAQRGSKTPWPATPTDLCPFGIEASIDNMCAWIQYVPSLPLLDYTRTVWQVVGCPSHYGMLINRIIPDAIPPVIDRLINTSGVSWWNDEDLRHSVEVTADIISQITRMNEDCARRLLQNKDPNRWQALFHTFFYASVAIDKLEHDTTSTPQGDFSQLGGSFYLAVIRFHMILDVVPRHPFNALEEQLGGVALLRPYDTTYNALLQFVEALHPMCENHLCGNPKCAATKLSRGGWSMRVCSGCQCVCFCSRACQKSAWKHAAAPHREVCSILYTLPRIPLESDGVFAVDQFRAACSRVGIDKPRAVRLVEYLVQVYTGSR